MRQYWVELADGWHATNLLLSLRWRMFRSLPSRVGLIVGVIFFGLIFLLVINMGYATQIAAQQGGGLDIESSFARYWIRSLSQGNMLNIGAFAVGGTLFATFVAPFVGTGTLTLAPIEDLAAYRFPRVHRYFDSLVINAISGLGVLQLLVLTGIASLLTMDGYRLPGLLFAWGLWLVLITTMSTVGWLVEIFFRKLGKSPRYLLVGGLFALVGVAAWIDPNHGSTLFGLSDAFAKTAREGIHGWTVASIITPIVLVFVAGIILLSGVAFARIATRLPIPAKKKARIHQARSLGNTPVIALWKLLIRVLWRTPEVRRPIVALSAIGVIVMLLVPLNQNVSFSLIAAGPLTVSLAWGMNIFGLFGTGMVWLASQPRLRDKMIWIIFVFQVTASMVLLLSFWCISFLAGHATPETFWTVFLGGGLSSTICASISLVLSVWKPRRARLSGRGDALLPPLVALGYTLLLVVLGPVPIEFILMGPLTSDKLWIVLGNITLSMICLIVAELLWKRRSTLARIVAITSAE